MSDEQTPSDVENEHIAILDAGLGPVFHALWNDLASFTFWNTAGADVKKTRKRIEDPKAATTSALPGMVALGMRPGLHLNVPR